MNHCCIIAAILTAVATHAFANDSRFLPGDSFFFIQFGARDVTSLTKSKSPTFRYGNSVDRTPGCGSVGYDEIQFVEMPKVDKEGLRDVYLRLKSELEDAFGKPDAMSVLVYNADYDWRRYGFALQYNENWAEESLTGGFVSRQFLTMTNFFESSEKHAASAIQRNWRDATLVPCLSANCRQKKEADGTSRNLPVESLQDRLYLILPDRNFENYLYPNDGAHFYHLLKGKIEHYRCKGRKWELIP